MGNTESRGCVSLSGNSHPGTNIVSEIRQPVFAASKLPPNEEITRNSEGFIPGPGELEYSWAEWRSGGGDVSTLLQIPRRDGDGKYSAKMAPLLVEAGVLDARDLNDPNVVAIACCYPGAYKYANEATSLGRFAAALDVDLTKGMPLHSRAYKSKTASATPKPTLTRLDLKATEQFQSFWVLEIPEKMNEDRLVETYSVLKRHCKDLAFFKNSRIVMPLIGFSSQSSVSLSEVVEQVISWAYHCFNNDQNLVSVTFVVPSDAHLQELEKAVNAQEKLVKELASRVSLESKGASELLSRNFVHQLEDALWDWSDESADYLAKTEGKAADDTERRKVFTTKVLAHHISLILDAFENNSDDEQLIRIICGSGRSVSEAFIAFDSAMKDYQNYEKIDEKIEYLLRVLEESRNARGLSAADFNQLRVLIAMGQLVKDSDFSRHLNVVDAIYALQAIVHLIFMFTKGDIPDVLKLSSAEQEAAEEEAKPEEAATPAAPEVAAAPQSATESADESETKEETVASEKTLADTIDWEHLKNTKTLQQADVEELTHVIQNKETGFKLGDRKAMLKTYKNAFVGSEAVAWMMENLHLTDRAVATSVCAALFKVGIIESCSKDKTFEDSAKKFYVFSAASVAAEHALSEKDITDLALQMYDSEIGVARKTHKIRFTNYNDAFLANDAVAWLAKNAGVDRAEAVGILNQMASNGFIKSVNGAAIKDDKTVLQFLDKVKTLQESDVDDDGGKGKAKGKAAAAADTAESADENATDDQSQGDVNTPRDDAHSNDGHTDDNGTDYTADDD